MKHTYKKTGHVKAVASVYFTYSEFSDKCFLLRYSNSRNTEAFKSKHKDVFHPKVQASSLFKSCHHST